MKIVMVCNLGISSTLMVKKLEAEALAQDWKLHIEPMALEDALRQTTLDFVLLSPQVAYAKKTLLGIVGQDSRLYQINPFAYSSLNAKVILDKVRKQLAERNAG